MTLLSHTELSIFCINIVLLTQIILTLLMTAIFATALNIPNQIPMSCARWATGLLRSHTILSESIRISKMLLARAKKGARGNAATKMVMKPNWITAKNKKRGCFNSRLPLNDRSASTWFPWSTTISVGTLVKFHSYLINKHSLPPSPPLPPPLVRKFVTPKVNGFFRKASAWSRHVSPGKRSIVWFWWTNLGRYKKPFLDTG